MFNRTIIHRNLLALLAPSSSLRACLLAAISSLLALFMTSCAMKVAPDGGPRDATPAAVSETTPASGTTNYTEGRITIDFDDYVDRSIRNAITIQPKVRFNTSYSGNSIQIDFTEDLTPNTTYSVTLGTDWRDLRGNSPLQATSIVFSTGPDIDTGAVRGTVHGQQLSNIFILLYPRADTLDSAFSPARDLSDYVMPVGSNGKYLVGGLRDGTYRIVAVQDQNSNSLIDANEQYAMAPSDVTVSQTTPASVDLLMGASLASMMADTAKPATSKELGARRLADSVKVDSVESEPVIMGSVEGTFVDSLNVEGPYLLRFIDRTDAVVTVVRVQSGESWTVSEIPPGTYSVDVVIDKNSNDQYDHGRSTPFAFAESWYPLGITVNVRQRWTTEGIRVLLK